MEAATSSSCDQMVTSCPFPASTVSEYEAKRVLAAEHDLYWRTIDRIRRGAIDLDALPPAP